VRVASYEICHDTAHLEKIFQDIMDKGGEGVILRDPGSAYEAGRSGGFLKHKVSSLGFYMAKMTQYYFLRNIGTQRPRL